MEADSFCAVDSGEHLFRTLAMASLESSYASHSIFCDSICRSSRCLFTDQLAAVHKEAAEWSW